MATSARKDASFSRGSEEVYNVICLPCHRDGTTLPAYGYCQDCQEHMCRGCLKYHKKATLSMHHKLLDQEAMPLTQQLTNASAHVGTADNLTTKCPRHTSDMIRFYCHDHKLLLCSVCVTLEHNKPCDVAYIPEIADKTVNGRDYKQTINRMENLLKKCTTVQSETSTDVNKANDSLKTALQEIKKYRQKINERIDVLQKTIEDTIQVLQHQHNEQMKNVNTISEDIKKIVKAMHDSLKQLNTSKEASQLFMEVQHAHKQLQDYEESITSLSRMDRIDEYKFIPSQSINDALQKEKMIGNISVKQPTQARASTQPNVLAPAGFAWITPTCMGELCVKTPKDKNTCFISGMTFLDPDRLVLVDIANKSIKLFDINSRSITTQLSLGREDADKPNGITSISNTEVVVTQQNRQQIMFISVSDKLRKSRQIQTDGGCCGICYYQSKLVVTYWRPDKIEILDMEGNVLKRVKIDSTGGNTSEDHVVSLFVQANSESIFVSDSRLTCVTMLNWNGDITGRIGAMDTPRGLSLLRDGSLLVCDNEGNKVCQVSENCNKSRIVLKDMIHPVCVCVHERGLSLWVSRWTNQANVDNNILEYKI